MDWRKEFIAISHQVLLTALTAGAKEFLHRVQALEKKIDAQPAPEPVKPNP